VRLLVVVTNYPFPPRTGSALVAYNSLKYLSKQHQIDLAGFQPSDGIPEPVAFVERMDLLPKKQYSKITNIIRYIFYALVGIPPSISSSASGAMKKLVESKLESRHFDAILLFEMNAIQYCPPSSFHKLFVNIEDPESIKMSRMGELPIWSSWKKVKLFLLTRLTMLYEHRVLPKMARVFLLSESDARDLRMKFPNDNFSHMSYGVDRRDSTGIMACEDRENSLIFSGSMFHPANVDGALFLLKDIFPLIIQQCPSAKLWIVGANPDQRIYEAAAKFGDNVVITGKVDDIDYYIKRSTVSICPVRLKIGVQTKILEALSWGTPVVTTSAGNSGINGITGTHMWVEDTPQLLAKRVCELIKGDDWQRLSTQGRQLVAERFSWEDSVTNLENQILASVVSDL
jgi:glycosyltransferase involved in cell wall biosynthesis